MDKELKIQSVICLTTYLAFGQPGLKSVRLLNMNTSSITIGKNQNFIEMQHAMKKFDTSDINIVKVYNQIEILGIFVNYVKVRKEEFEPLLLRKYLNVNKNEVKLLCARIFKDTAIRFKANRLQKSRGLFADENNPNILVGKTCHKFMLTKLPQELKDDLLELIN